MGPEISSSAGWGNGLLGRGELLRLLPFPVEQYRETCSVGCCQVGSKNYFMYLLLCYYPDRAEILGSCFLTSQLLAEIGSVYNLQLVK